jgi:hypothetical protein
MNAKTLKALKGSISKWQSIVNGTGEDKGPSNCPLCKLFFLSRSMNAEGCSGCPVFSKTGLLECNGTPYKKWVLHNAMAPFPFKATNDKLRKLANAELEFLKSLLPNKRKTP